MQHLLQKKNTRVWSLFVVLVMVFQVLSLAVGTGSAKAADSLTPDLLTAQPGGKTQWVAVGSWQGWNNSSKDTTLTHLVGDFYEYSTVLDAGHYEFKLVKSGTWDGYSNNGNNFAFDLSETSKVNLYINDSLNQARINLPNVAGLPQYTPKLTADKWPRLVGTVQSAFGEPDWSPDKAQQFFVDYNFDGSVYKLQRPFPVGKYEAKATLGPNWDENYGADGQGGSNVSLATLDPADVTFTLDLNKKTLSHDYKPQDGAFDGQIQTSKLSFDSRSVTYKKPFGAIPEQSQDLTLRIGAEKGDVQIAKVDLTNGTGVTSSYPMKKATTVGDRDYFEVTIPKAVFQGIGIWGYKFILIDGATKVEYGDDSNRGGLGAASAEGAVPFDLTVYKKDFKTPDWMKNAVVYQIFVDRFFDGDQTNNRAKTADGFRGPSNPSQPGLDLTSKGGFKVQYFDGGVKKDPTPSQVWGDWFNTPENPDRSTPENKPYYPDQKTDGMWTNEFYGGDIQGIVQKLDYLKTLGVNVLYLNPVAWAASNHKYDATDYKHLDPMFGEPVYNKPSDPASGLDYEKTKVASDRVFTKFAKEAEKRGIHLIMDGVFNHVGDDSIYFDRYNKYPEIGAYEYWSKVWDKVNDEHKTQAQAEQEVRKSFTDQINPATGKHYAYPDDFDFTTWFTVKNEKQFEADGKTYRYKYDGWWGYDSMPAADAKDPQPGDSEALAGQHEWNNIGYRNNVIGHDLTGQSKDDQQKEMQYANSERWEWLGASGWRLDVAPDVSSGTWQQFRKAVKSTTGLKNSNNDPIDDPIILGEEWGVATRFLLGDQFDSVMNYRFRGALQNFMINGNAAAFHDALESIREDYPQEAWEVMLNLVDSHDTTRSITKYDHPEWEEEHLQIAPDASDKALKEQALTAILQMGYPGAPTIYYGDEVGLAGTKDPDSRRTFPWERVTGKNDKFSGTGRYQELFDIYKKAVAVRNDNSVFRTGDLKEAYADGDVIAYARKNDSKAGLVVVNRSDKPQTFDAQVAGFLPDGLTMQDQLFGTFSKQIANGHLTITIPAQSGMMLVSKEKLTVVPQVTNLQATPGNKQVTLNWTAVTGATGYTVYRAPIEGGTVEKAGTASDTTFTDRNVVNGTKYYYAVTAQKGTSESFMGDMVSATPSFAINSVAITTNANDMTMGVGKTTSDIAVTIDVPGLTDDQALQGKDATNLTARLAFYKQGTDKALAYDTKLRYKNDTADGKKVYTATFEPFEAGAWTYFAKVSTDNGDTVKLSSESTVQVSADPNDTTPPAAPVLSDINTESNRAELKWTVAGSDITGLDVYRKTADSSYQKIATLEKDAIDYVDYTVSNDTAYTYKVAAFDSSYNRAFSAEKSVTPKLVMVDVTLRLHLPDYTPTSDDIYIAGDFNGWNASGGKLDVPSGATTRDVMEYHFKMMAGKSIQYKYTRGSWTTEAFASHKHQANDTTDFGNWAYSSTDTNMTLTVQNQGANQMVLDDYVLRFVDMPMILTMPRITYGSDVAYTTTDETFTLKGVVPYGVSFTMNGTELPPGAMDAKGNVYLENIPLQKGLNTFTLHIEPTDETLNLPWYSDKGRKSQATKTITLSITRN